MEIKKIETVFPGTSVPKNTFPSHNDNAYIYGQLLSVNNLNYILTKSKRYIPQKDDIVIGKITHKTPEYYKIDLGGNYAYLPVLNFPNATKRNKPEMQIGEYVMARIIKINDVPLLFCDQKVEGYVFNVGTWAVKIMKLKPDILCEIGNNYKFKIGMGMNGFIWIFADEIDVVRDVLTKIQDIKQNLFL